MNDLSFLKLRTASATYLELNCLTEYGHSEEQRDEESIPSYLGVDSSLPLRVTFFYFNLLKMEQNNDSLN